MSPRTLVFECLARSDDGSVEDLLLHQLENIEEPFCVWAVEVLLDRARPASLGDLVQRHDKLPEACQRVLARRIDLLEGALREAIRHPVRQTCDNAVALISDSGAWWLAYVLAMALRHPATDTRKKAADALLGLVRSHQSTVIDSGWSHVVRDTPAQQTTRLQELSSARVLLASALKDALASYDRHLRTTVVEAVLLLSEDLEAEILGEARKRSGRFWHAALEKLFHAPDDGAAAIALQALADEHARPAIIKLLSQCTLPSFFRSLWQHCWLLGDPRIRDGLSSVKRLAWLEEDTAALLDLPAVELRQALRFVEATSVPAPILVQLYQNIMLAGDSDKQLMALFALLGTPDPKAVEGLQAVIQWAEPQLADLARRELSRRQACADGGTLRGPTAGHPGAVPVADFDSFWDAFPWMDPGQRLEIGRQVLKTDARTLAQLQTRMTSQDQAQRLQAIQIIRLLSLEPRCAAEVFRAVRDAHAHVRSAAVKALQQLTGGAANRLLLEALGDRDGRVRANAIEVLAAGDVERVVHHVVPHLRDPHHRVRSAAIHVLLRLKIPAAAEALLRLLKDSSRAHRASGLWLVDRLDLADVIHQVSHIASHDPDQQVRKRASTILRAARRSRVRRGPATDPAEHNP